MPQIEAIQKRASFRHGVSPGLGPTLPRVGGVFFYEEAAALTLQQGHSLRRSEPQHVELVSKNQDFRLKPCSRPE
jgi:hypothetical protein